MLKDNKITTCHHHQPIDPSPTHMPLYFDTPLAVYWPRYRPTPVEEAPIKSHWIQIYLKSPNVILSYERLSVKVSLDRDGDIILTSFLSFCFEKPKGSF